MAIISSPSENKDFFYMRKALSLAEIAAREDEVPVGAVVVYRGEVVGTGYNRREHRQNPVSHAEISAIQQAAECLKTWRLNECELFVTLEPCIMCAGAILQARLSRLVFGCLDPKAGAVESLYRLCGDKRLNHQAPATYGILGDECAALLSNFFSRLRKGNQDIAKTERWPSPAEGA